MMTGARWSWFAERRRDSFNRSVSSPTRIATPRMGLASCNSERLQTLGLGWRFEFDGLVVQVCQLVRRVGAEVKVALLGELHFNNAVDFDVFVFITMNYKHLAAAA